MMWRDFHNTQFEVFTERDVATDEVRIWFVDRARGLMVRRRPDGMFETYEKQEGHRYEPALVLPASLYNALVRDSQRENTNAQAKHLDDAIKVRDRVLSMVDRLTGPPVMMQMDTAELRRNG